MRSNSVFSGLPRRWLAHAAGNDDFGGFVLKLFTPSLRAALAARQSSFDV